MLGEFEFIAARLKPLAAGTPGALDLEDDAALLDLPAGMSLVLTKDAMVAGVHFLHDDPPGEIAKKLLRVNLSDLAAMGAAPLGYLLALARAKETPESWLADFRAIATMPGVGWAITYQDPSTGWLFNHWITLHNDGNPAGFKPVLVMDGWEHAFMRDYQATERAKYVDAFFKNVDWESCEQRLK